MLDGSTPDNSVVEIVLLVLSVIIMPVLAAAQRRVGTRLGDPVMLADAAETKMCVLLSISTLLGLVLFAITGQGWRDPVAGFVIAAFAINQGPDAWEGEFVDADDDDDDD